MEKIKVELKSMQSNPRLYLANYFSDLKRDVDLTFNQVDKLEEKAKYLEIINKIEEKLKKFFITKQKLIKIKNKNGENKSRVKINAIKSKIIFS